MKYAVSEGIMKQSYRHSVHRQSFLVVTTLLATTLEFLALLLFNSLGLNYISAGALALVYSIIYQYSRLVPSAYRFRIFGIQFNNKSLNYFLAFQVRINEFHNSQMNIPSILARD